MPQLKSRDEIIMGKAGGKKKEPPLTSALQAAIDAFPIDTAEMLQCKELGNTLFKAGNYTQALKYYGLAIKLDPSSEVLLSNRSAAYLESSLHAGPAMALKDAEACIQLKPDWFKGHLRKADALFVQEKFSEAIVSYDQCLKLSQGSCQTALESKRACESYLVMGEEKEKNSPSKGANQSFNNTSYPEGKVPHSPLSPDAEEKEKLQKLEPEELVSHWTKDTALSGASARKTYSSSVMDADRSAGQAAKNSFMQSYKKKCQSSDPKEADDKSTQKEQELLKGLQFDYKEAEKKKTGKEEYRNGTDAVGNAIQAEAYASYMHKTKAW